MKKTKKIRIKKSIKSGFNLCLGIILSILSIWCMYSSLNMERNDEKSIINLNSKRNLNYQVYLQENPYFTTPYLNSGGRYITSIVDYLKMQVDYSFQADQKFDYAYQYRVIATVSSNQTVENKKEQVWSKSYMIKTGSQVTLTNSDQFQIQDEVIVPVAVYKNAVAELEKNYVLALDSVIDVNVYVDIIGKKEGYSDQIISNEVLELKIPISEDTMNVTSNYDKDYSKNISEKIEVNTVQNKPLFIFSCLAFGFAVVVLAISALEFIKNSKEQFSYTRERNKILKKYDSIIVNAKSTPSLKDKEIIEVIAFDELVDAEEELHIPIIYVEIVPGAVGWFLIIHKNQVWRYILRGQIKR